ncbi:MAG: hypothetical protein IPM82_15825 [Saprospiraceae bacterium]|nr:hypothetical protein [Saprospiraceae bacterium]
MKKILLFSLLALIFTVAFTNEAMAQKKGKKKSSKTDEYFDDSGFANKLWYGGNFLLGFAGSNNQSQFTFGLAPMIGYKLVNDLISIGPWVGFEYNNMSSCKASGAGLQSISAFLFCGSFCQNQAVRQFFRPL